MAPPVSGCSRRRWRRVRGGGGAPGLPLFCVCADGRVDKRPIMYSKLALRVSVSTPGPRRQRVSKPAQHRPCVRRKANYCQSKRCGVDGDGRPSHATTYRVTSTPPSRPKNKGGACTKHQKQRHAPVPRPEPGTTTRTCRHPSDVRGHTTSKGLPALAAPPNNNKQRSACSHPPSADTRPPPSSSPLPALTAAQPHPRGRSPPQRSRSPRRCRSPRPSRTGRR